jgi:site-specific recombinase XerD
LWVTRSQEEIAQLIDDAPTAFHRTVLMTLYATGVGNAELTHLKISDVDSQRMVVHVQANLADVSFGIG